jgi:hypothetical protein
MADKPHYTAAQIIAALQETKGMMFLAAKRLGCSHETIRRYCQRYPTVQAAKDMERGEMVDTAELKLWHSIQQGEAWGIAFCLKTLGKDRGYVERSEVTGPGGGPVQMLVIQGDLGSGNSDPVQIPQAATGTNGAVQGHEAL